MLAIATAVLRLPDVLGDPYREAPAACAGALTHWLPTLCSIVLCDCSCGLITQRLLLPAAAAVAACTLQGKFCVQCVTVTYGRHDALIIMLPIKPYTMLSRFTPSQRPPLLRP